MPKRTTVFGSERTNLMYTLIGKILQVGSIEVSELASQLGVSEREVADAIRTISITETGTALDYTPFLIDEDTLKSGIAEFNDYPLDLDVPKISARQAAAISAGLRYLMTIPGFALKTEVEQLLGLLNQSSIDEATQTISFSEAHIDSDVTILRQAISELKAIRCEYINAAGVRSQRTMDPLRLESRDPVWYLRAYCHKNQKVLAFRLDRMDHVEILDLPVSAEALQAEITDDIYVPNNSDHTVSLLLHPEAYSVIADYKAVDQNPSKTTGEKRVTIQVRDLGILGPLAAAHGGHLIVEGPEEARRAVRDYCLTALGEDREAE